MLPLGSIKQVLNFIFNQALQPQRCVGKWEAVVKEIKRMNKTGRPVLVGTTSVEQSEFLASQLQKDGPYSMLQRSLI